MIADASIRRLAGTARYLEILTNDPFCTIYCRAQIGHLKPPTGHPARLS